MKITSPYAVLLYLSLGTISRGDTNVCNATDGKGAWVGDGACDPQNLIPECDWDGGDCCRCTCVDKDFVCGTDGFFCLDPDVLEDDFTTCEEITPSLCSEDIPTKWVVETAAQVRALAEAVNCSGGNFNVEWKGDIVVDTEIVIEDGTVLTIVGAGSGAVIDGGGITRLFRVVNASLQITNLEIRNGNATFGGAIAVMASTLVISGTNFTGNTAHKTNGGALFVYGGSNVSFLGETGFSDNTSNSRGGAFYVFNSSVSWDGVSSFSGNSATQSGGALCAVVGSTVSWAAKTSFRGNYARNYNGGALFLEGNVRASWTVDAYFINNSARLEAGAIFVNLRSDASWSEGASFSGNNATVGGGGAMVIQNSSNVALNGVTLFQSNSCGVEGGAVSLRSLDSGTFTNSGNQKSFLSIKGTATFDQNECGSNGGGLAVLGDLSVVMGAGIISFVKNEAVVAGGGVSISATGEGPTFANASFMSNYAEVGGGVFITGSGTLLDPDDGKLSATFQDCAFSDNKANVTGGALESANGTVAISNTYFKGNEAEVGGALRLAGASFLSGCTFEDNISDLDGGQAISGIGVTLEMENCSFLDNGFNCGPGNVYYEGGPGDRFAAVCSGCEECENCFVEMEGREPTCLEVMEHSTSPGGSNVTLITLRIDPGYWRATNDSTNVLACYNEDACQGGLTGSDNYCKAGYGGPYCAVCNDNYVKGPGFTCTKCSETVWGIVTVVMCCIAAVVTTVLGIKYIISAEVGAERGIFARFLSIVPLQSVKAIIVVWQILTNFTEAANVIYPETYKAFLDVVNFLNIDLWVFSFGCMMYVDFHLRFLAVTIGPMVAILMLSGTYLYAVRRHDASDDTLKIVRQRHMAAVLFILFFVYTSASTVILQMFDCDTLDDGNVYLRQDYTIHCNGPGHRVLRVFAGLMFLLYSLGIPVFFTLLLFKNRRVLLNETLRENVFNVRLFSDLWKPYKPSRFYYEIIEFARRLVLTIVSIFIVDDSVAQFPVTLMVAVFFAMISEGLAPYDSNWMSGYLVWGTGW